MSRSETVKKNTPKKTVLCVFGRLLGGNSFSAELDSALANYGHLNLIPLDFKGSDYAKYPAPWYAKLSASTDASFRIRKKFYEKKLDMHSIDVLFFQSMHLTLPFKRLIAKKPTVISLDTTPMLAHNSNIQVAGVRARVRAVLSKILDTLFFNDIFNNCDYFLARTDAVKDSLIKDYHVSAEKIVSTYIPLDIDPFSVAEITIKPIIIFVGNDFKRKGGPFLLKTFEKHLQKYADLLIVSNEKTMAEYVLPQGAEWRGGLPRNEVLELYKKSHIFVLPTWKDDLGLAICEAIASGLPVVVRDSTAQKEIVKNGINGYLMPYESNVDEWGEALLKLINNQEIRERFARESHNLANQLFSREVFQMKLQKALCATNLL